MAGIEMTHVPYRGVAPAMNDLIPGRVDLLFSGGATLENAKAGQVRGLGYTGAARTKIAPEVPTIAESGVPGFDVSPGTGFSCRPRPRRHRQEDQRRYREGARRSRHQRQARAARLHGRRFHARRTRNAPEIRNRPMGPRHQGRRNFRRQQLKQRSESRMITRRHLLKASAASALAPSLIARPARAQSPPQPWPNRFVKIVVLRPGGDRRDRAHRRRPARQGLGPAGRGREQGRRRRQYRHRDRRTRRTRRLHRAGRSSALAVNRFAVPIDQLRSRSPTSRRSRCSARFANLMCGAEVLAGQIGQGVHRVRQGEPGQADLCVARPRHAAAHGGELFKLHGQDRHHPRALSRRGAGLSTI